MILEKGDMWSVFDTTDIFMITTNPIIKQNGSVVMGRGIALEAKTRFPKLPYTFGTVLSTLGNNFVDWIDTYNGTPIWYFMVKDHWANNANLSIIASSIWTLKEKFKDNPVRIDLNFLGIGNGKLSRKSVLYLIQDLPDNVHVWEKE